MAHSRLTAVKELGNRGLALFFQQGTTRFQAFVPAKGDVSVTEAAVALGTSGVMLHRLQAKKGMSMKRDRTGRWRVPVTEVLRLKREWAETGPTLRMKAAS